MAEINISGFLRATRKAVFATLLLLVAGLVLYLLAAYYYTYSSGESAGYVQKFSSKGWLCKTWEGEQIRALGQQINLAEKFVFTAQDDAVAQKINTLIGQKVVLEYKQRKGLPSCFGDTEYFVVDVRPMP